MMKSLLLIIACLFSINIALASPIKIVAAENFYGQLSHEIGGAGVNVTSIISNPNADPHLFTTSASVAQALSQAQIIIYNGANYDPWIAQMLDAIDKHKVIVINVANLMGIKADANPHIWYRVDTFPKLAQVLANDITQLNPAIKPQVQLNLQHFLLQNRQVQTRVMQLKSKYHGIKVTATEPVFGYMAQAIGLDMQGLDFQWKIMNNTEPSPQMLAQYEKLFTLHQVQVLFYNNQVTDSVTQNIMQLAKQNNIKIVGVSETMPQGVSVNQWLLAELQLTGAALRR